MSGIVRPNLKPDVTFMLNLEVFWQRLHYYLIQHCPWLVRHLHTSPYLPGPRDSNMFRPTFFFPSTYEWVTLLNLRATGLSEIPESVTRIDTLKSLILDANTIETIETNVSGLTSLETFSACENNIHTIHPNSIGTLSRLTCILLSLNSLTQLPQDFQNLTQLETLHLAQNKFTEPPNMLSGLRNLKKLSLKGCPIRSLSLNLSATAPIDTLWLGGCCIENIPDNFCPNANLSWIRLRRNKITHIPPHIGQFTALTSLDFKANNVTSIPGSIKFLENLEYLFLSGNNISSLPNEICNLTKLTHLSIANNKLTKLPENIGNMTKLDLLDVRHNNIRSVPPSVSQLQHLQTFYAYGNPIKQFPALSCDSIWVSGQQNTEHVKANNVHRGAVSIACLYGNFLLRNGNDECLVFFAVDDFDLDFARKLSITLGTDVMFLSDPWMSNFRQHKQILDHVIHDLKHCWPMYNKVHLFGISRGGYGALAYVSHADTVTCFSPMPTFFDYNTRNVLDNIVVNHNNVPVFIHAEHGIKQQEIIHLIRPIVHPHITLYDEIVHPVTQCISHDDLFDIVKNNLKNDARLIDTCSQVSLPLMFSSYHR